MQASQKVLLESLNEGILTLTLNRPKKFNAIDIELYETLGKALNAASYNIDVKVIVLTGNGSYYSAGNDLGGFFNNVNLAGISKATVYFSKHSLFPFVNSFIECTKPIIAAVNGPAIGIAVTTLGLIDFVYAVEGATFSTPFMKLAQGAEACSSYTFPKIMGARKAAEMLLLGQVITAKEAKEVGFINEVLPKEKLMLKVMEVAKKLASFDTEAVIESKKLIHGIEVSKLIEVNIAECKNLEIRWASDASMAAINDFRNRKAKL